jgi:hypothetical protein
VQRSRARATINSFDETKRKIPERAKSWGLQLPKVASTAALVSLTKHINKLGAIALPKLADL